MPQRVVNVAEKTVVADPAQIIPIPGTNTSVTVLPDVTASFDEFAGRYIFNAGANNVFYAIGQDCNATNSFNGYLVPGQQLDISNTCQRVSAAATAVSSIALTVLRRKDLSTTQNIFSQQ
jgi:hypothetical protein